MIGLTAGIAFSEKTSFQVAVAVLLSASPVVPEIATPIALGIAAGALARSMLAKS